MPHLCLCSLPVPFPPRWWQLPYYWIGIKLYDLVAGSQCLKSSYVLTKSRALELFPMLRRDRLVGAIVYYDGAWPLLLLWAPLGFKHRWELDMVPWLSAACL